MLDIKFIRKHPDLVKSAAQKKNISIDVDSLIELDTQRIELLTSIENLRAQQNEQSQLIPQLTTEVEKAQAVSAMKVIKEELKRSVLFINNPRKSARLFTDSVH